MSINLKSTDSFERRHIGPTPEETAAMLKLIGAKSVDELIDQTVPPVIRLKGALDLPEALSESNYLKELKKTASKNQVFRSYIGLGYYNTLVPSVIKRNILENPGWYTQYTPYQAEISQGRLEALLNYQTLVSDLTGLEIANASLLDEGTAAGEAMIMFYNQRNRTVKGEHINKFFVSDKCLPQTIDVLQTRALPLDIHLVVGDASTFVADETFFGVLVQYPDRNGSISDFSALAAQTHAAGAYIAFAADLLSLALLTEPAALGADCVIGNSQRLGVPMGFGGPHAAFFSTKSEFLRLIPGRLIGVSEDAHGRKAYRMTLQTREQHIKREKATSNICTAQALLAIMAGMYAVYHGPEGLRNIALRVHTLARLLSAGLHEMGFVQENENYFDTLCIHPGATSVDAIRKAAVSRQMNFNYTANGRVCIAVDESTQPEDLQDILNAFAEASGKTAPTPDFQKQAGGVELVWDKKLIRSSEYLSHPVFNRYHSETEMMRYIKKLENRDLSLTSSMIPLGSCTMKLNAASELYPITWPEFGNLHPFVPADQAQGYAQIITELEQYLAKITGFAATSLQPNSGAQGEYAGLMVIMAYHQDRGEPHRRVVLIPSSAHGTNPASAVMAGMQVVVTKCDENGNIDVADLLVNADKHKDNLAGLMVTYPSTHGVFEESIIQICNLIHERGGLVYMDGANLNAQVGLTSPSNIGADVCHINLHKTFAIPHGGGGPGMGPICVNEKLAPYLPGHPLVKTGGGKAITAVSAAPWGSASILLISYGYIRMLGAEGVVNATKWAILNANYLKARLEAAYKILYVGANGRVAHEFIMDFRNFKVHGIEVEDVAKRLMDYSFHAPTVSFPVPGTLMVEPTESEPKAELDRLADALLAIYAEIQEVIDGKADKTDNVLKNAPHTYKELCADNWPHSYGREKAAFPMPGLRDQKFWTTVSRINNTLGDRNVVCVCPPIESYA